MTSPRTDLPFDDGPIRAQLLGTWSCPKPEEPSEVDYLHFHESGIVFQFYYDPKLEKHFRVRLKYVLESPSRLRVCNIKGDQTGWTNGYQLEGNALTLIHPSRTYVCARVATEEAPEWFREAMAKYL